MAKCNGCGKALAKNAQFCGHCGAKVIDRCPKCGNTDLAGPNFCIRCGTNLRGEPRPASSAKTPTSAAESEDDLEAELKVYKASWEDGQHIITCPHCGAKNRIPTSKLQLGPACGRCKQTLPAS